MNVTYTNFKPCDRVEVKPGAVTNLDRLISKRGTVVGITVSGVRVGVLSVRFDLDQEIVFQVWHGFLRPLSIVEEVGEVPT